MEPRVRRLGGSVKERVREADRLMLRFGFGELVLLFSPLGLCRVLLPPTPPSEPSQAVRVLERYAQGTVAQKWSSAAEQELIGLLSGRGLTSPLVPVDLSSGTSFEQQVWSSLRLLGVGELITYTELAVRIGRPTAVRAVARACATNPVPLWIPCHRVVPKKGGLGGYHPGTGWKAYLIKQEIGQLNKPVGLFL